MHAEPSCVYACPHDAAHRVEPRDFFAGTAGAARPGNAERARSDSRRSNDRAHRPHTQELAGRVADNSGRVAAALRSPIAVPPALGVDAAAARCGPGVRQRRLRVHDFRRRCSAARKKVPVCRFGRAQTWMRGHLWLGLAEPADHFVSRRIPVRRHGLTAWLMMLLIIVVASGVFGAALQHYMPHVMTREVPWKPSTRRSITSASSWSRSGDETIVAAAESGRRRSRALRRCVRFLPARDAPVSGKPRRAPPAAFQSRSLAGHVRGPAHAVAAGLQDAAKDLEQICEEERQLRRQSKLHHWLHGWLMLHIPLSFALLLLGVVHAITALRY